MKRITAGEMLELADYERVRGRLRPLFIHEKDHRRLAIGRHLTMLFENEQTVGNQIQEMVRTGKLATADASRTRSKPTTSCSWPRRTGGHTCSSNIPNQHS